MKEAKTKLKSVFNIGSWKKPSRKDEFYFIYALKKFVHIVVFSARRFYDENCFLHMGALSFYCIISVVPVIAMAFAVAKSFGMESYLYREIEASTTLQNKEIWMKLVEFSKSMLDRTQGGIIAGVGVLVLLWSIISTLNNIEGSFNQIWNIKQGRTWLRKVTDYLTISLLFPIFLILIASVSVYISGFVEKVIVSNPFAREFQSLYTISLHLLPIALITIVIFLVFIIIPNTYVSPKSALYGAIFTAVVFQGFEQFYVYYQLKLTGYNAVYGSFAALPFFFLWVYYSWGIVLFGMNIVFQHMSFNESKTSMYPFKLNNYQEKFLSLLILFEVVKNFKNENNRPMTLEQMSSKLNVSLDNIKLVIDKLLEVNLIRMVVQGDKRAGYSPSFAIQNYTIENILQKFDNTDPDPNFEKLYTDANHMALKEKLDALEKAIKLDKGNVKLDSLISQMGDF